MLRVQQGDLQPMGLLFQRYHRELFGFLYHMCHNPEASEDMVQTTFYRMIKYKNSFSGQRPFRSWMYQIARNVLLDTYQREQRSRQQVDIDDLVEQLTGGIPADESIQKAEQALDLQRALDQLSDDHREVLILSEFQELKYKEIAQILDTTEGAIKVRVHRAIHQLKTIFLNREHNA